MQVYAVILCSRTKEILVFKKNERGYFFQGYPKKRIKHIQIKNTVFYPEGYFLNGGGKNCFPGGKVDRVKDREIENCALREFKEETGFDLAVSSRFSKKQIIGNGYCAFVFDMSSSDFNTCKNICVKNFENKRQLIDDVKKKILDEEDISAKLFEGITIKDDELESVTVESLDKCPSDFIKDSNETGWFFEIWNTIVENYLRQSKSSKKEW